jgi:hypothetical protein
MGHKVPRLSGNISDLSSSTGATFGDSSNVEDEDGISDEDESIRKGSREGVTNKTLLQYKDELQLNNQFWKKSENGGLNTFLNNRDAFLELCEKHCPEVMTMR